MSSLQQVGLTSLHSMGTKKTSEQDAYIPE